MKYMRKTPVEAIQWNGDNQQEVSDFIYKTIKTYSTWADDYGNLIIAYEYVKRSRLDAFIPKFGWVVRDGKTLQFYKDATFRKTFEEVQKDDHKGIDRKGMSNTLKETLDGYNEFFKGFKSVFGVGPNKEALGAGVCITPDHIKIDNLYKGYEKTHEEVKMQLSDGLKEMASNKEKEYSHGKTKGIESDTFESVLNEMRDLHAKKDKDYSGSFHNLFKEYGMPYALCHIEEKLNRVKAIIANGGNAVTNEHVEDSLIDGACYNILTLIELRNRKH